MKFRKVMALLIILIGMLSFAAEAQSVQFHVPFEAGTKHNITNTYTSSHQGVDFGTHNHLTGQYNPKIMVVADGKVVEVIDNHSGGLSNSEINARIANKTCWQVNNKIIVDHGNGIKSGYLHIAQGSARVTEGQTIASGTYIADMGNTGCSYDPHLHFYATNNGSFFQPTFIEPKVIESNPCHLGCYISQNSSTPQADAPFDQNLTLNWDFTGLDHWQIWGDAEWTLYDNVLHTKRQSGGTSGSVTTETGAKVSSYHTLELSVDLGNSSSVEKRPNVILRDRNSWETVLDCEFVLPPGSPMQTYTLRGPSYDWENVFLEIWPSPPDGQPDVKVDNVLLFYRSEPVNQTQCVEQGKKKSWDFSTDGSWVYTNHLTAHRFRNDGVAYTISGNDPILHGPVMPAFNASDYRYVRIEMTSNADDCATVFWSRPDQPYFASGQHINFDVINDNQRHVYYVDLQADTDYTGMIDQLRFDPSCTMANNNTLAVHSIELTNEPPVDPATIQVVATTTQSTVAVGETSNIQLELQNPDKVDGVYALDVDCTILPAGILTGQSMNAGNVFGNDAVEISPGFQPDNSFVYAISQRGTDPAVILSGVFSTLSLSAIAEGQATLDCTTNVIDGTETMIEIPFQPITITVEPPASDNGIVSGIVHREVAIDEGITIELLQNDSVLYSATTQADGSFMIADVPTGSYDIRATSVAYLSAVGTVDVAAGQTATMPEITLLAGEVVSSDSSAGVIDLLDASTLGAHYLSTVPPAPESADSDFNDVVDLQDLYRLSSNWGQVTSIWN